MCFKKGFVDTQSSYAVHCATEMKDEGQSQCWELIPNVDFFNLCIDSENPQYNCITAPP